MSIYVTGDCHGEFSKFNTVRFPAQKELTKDDYVIVAGDFGGYWDGSEDQKWWRKWLTEKPFRVLFVDGNHENYDLLNRRPAFSWHGGLVRMIPDTDILHLMRGQMYTVDGCRIFTFGGARSHDIGDGIIPYDPYGNWRKAAKALEKQGRYAFRVEHLSWWKEEMPDEKEMETGRRALEAAGNQCDYIITHECPGSVLVMLYGGAARQDAFTEYLEEIRQTVKYRRWYFGHHHDDLAVTDREILLYDNVVQLW